MKSFLALIIVLATSTVSATLQVFPTRVLLTEKTPSAHLTIRHKGSKPTNYKIKTVFYKMKPDGSMLMINDAKPRESAVELIRFSPRTVQLKPDEEQVVRLLAYNTKTLEDGEYRAHLYFESMDNHDDFPVASNSSGGAAQFFLKARLAVAIPIIIRHGQVIAEAEISQVKIVKRADGKWGFALKLHKLGEGNLYGDLKINVVGRDGTVKQVGTVNGVSSYIPERIVDFELSEQNEEVLRGGTLQAQYFLSSAEGGKLLATADEGATTPQKNEKPATKPNENSMLNEPLVPTPIVFEKPFSPSESWAPEFLLPSPYASDVVYFKNTPNFFF
jgi:hypothetical protein